MTFTWIPWGHRMLLKGVSGKLQIWVSMGIIKGSGDLRFPIGLYMFSRGFHGASGEFQGLSGEFQERFRTELHSQ